MRTDTFLDSVGMIDEKFLDVEKHPVKIRHSKLYKRIAVAVAAAVLVICPLPTLTAFGYTQAYNVLYHISPSIAQTFKPVQRSCNSNGYEMTVISAEINEDKASVYLAMHDTTESCPYGDWDLYDSYSINTPKDMIGYCNFSEYDSENHTAYFVVNLETMDGSDITNGKVTFSVKEMLLGKINTSAYIDSIDMKNVPINPETVSIDSVNGKYYYMDEPNPLDYRFLTSNEAPLCSPANGVSVMNIGYIDDALHILVKYEDKIETDNHGHISLIDSNKNMFDDKYEIGFSYRDTSGKDEYIEQIFEIPYENLKDMTLYGEFSTTQKHIKGDWEVTFQLK